MRLPRAQVLDARPAPARGATALSFELCDDEGLRSYQVYVDDVPLFPGLGRPVTGRRARVTEEVVLTDGVNKVEVSALDAAGQESLRAFRLVGHEDPTPPDLYYLGFGVSRYRDPALALRYAHKDARDLAAHFARSGEGFREVHVRTCVDEEVTVEGIRSARGPGGAGPT